MNKPPYNIEFYVRLLSAKFQNFQTMFSNLYTEKTAESYSQYRPTYPPEVTNRILDYCKEAEIERNLALDVSTK